MGGDPLRKVALGCIRKECDKGQRSQPTEKCCSSVVSASVSAQALALTSLQGGLQAVRTLNPFLPKVLLVRNKKDKLGRHPLSVQQGNTFQEDCEKNTRSKATPRQQLGEDAETPAARIRARMSPRKHG